MSDIWEPASDLRESEAIKWYRSAVPLAPSALGYAVEGLEMSFDASTLVAAIAPLDPPAQRPNSLFFAVSGDVEDDETWGQLVNANRHLGELAGLASTTDMDQALQRLHLVIAKLPEPRPLADARVEWLRL
jgi:hypothetical protein